MTTILDLKRVANSLDGYTGSKGNDNVNKIWAELDPVLQGASYCAAGDCYIWKHAGHPWPAIDHAWGFSFCPDAVIWAKKHGMWDASGHYHPGDTPFYSWDGTGVAEHTGTMFEELGSQIYDFECNTTPENGVGDQSNGGGCYYRHRPHGSMLLGVIKSSHWLDEKPHPTPLQPKHNPFTYHAGALPLHVGSRGDMVRWAQWALGVPVDGVFGPATKKATLLKQRAAGIKQDGVIGAVTASVLIRVTRWH